MLAKFRVFWGFLGDVISSMPSEVVSVVLFCAIGVCIIGMLRSL